MPYNVELCYGYFEGECGIYHAFRLVAPEKDFPDDVEKSLTESLETEADFSCITTMKKAVAWLCGR